MALPAFYTAMPRRNQLILVYGTPVIIAIALAFWCYKCLGTIGLIDPQYDDTNSHIPASLQHDDPSSIWTSIQAKETEIKASDTAIARRPAIEKQLAELQSSMDAMNGRLPKSNEKAEVRELIERLARDIPKEFGTVQITSVQIVDSGAGGRGTSNEARTVVYQVNFLADQGGLIKYLDEIEQNQRFMAINRISVKSGGFEAEKSGKIIYHPHLCHIDIETKIYNPVTEHHEEAQ